MKKKKKYIEKFIKIINEVENISKDICKKNNRRV